jgi:hypothetical protein
LYRHIQYGLPTLRGAARLLPASLLIAAASAGSATAAEIPQVGSPPAQQFKGAAWDPYPVFGKDPPRHPWMAPNGRSNLHDDAFQTDSYQGLGPLGHDIKRTSTSLTSDCGSVTFDTRGRIVTVCVGLSGPTLRILDAHTLATLDSMTLPIRNLLATDPTKIFTDFSGGGYFYLDNTNHAVVGTNDRHMYTVATASPTGAPDLRLVRDVDLNDVIPQSDKIISALPDFSGRLWFITVGGIVGTIDRVNSRVESVDTHEHNGNSFALGPDGEVYVVTNGALYRYEADSFGRPIVVWRQPYENVGAQKPGQTQAGSGTTPTVMEDGLITITDNADPMNVVVYKTARHVTGRREVCRIPVFPKGGGSTDNSLIVARRSIIVENNYGYTGPASVELGATTRPGIERVDVDPARRSCRKVWESHEIAPTVVPKLSLAAGLVYAYTKPADGGSSDPWYLTALDFRTGRTVWSAYAGSGLGFNNNYAPVTLGPDGTAYVGVIGGLAALRDSTVPRLPSTPRIGASLRRAGARRARIVLTGRDRELTRRMDVLVSGHRRARLEVPPFNVTVPARRGARITINLRLADNRTRTLRGRA